MIATLIIVGTIFGLGMFVIYLMEDGERLIEEELEWHDGYCKRQEHLDQLREDLKYLNKAD